MNDKKTIYIPFTQAILQPYIFGYMYGKKEISNSKIVKINKDELEPTISQDGFVYTWGWPGPDFNIYSFKDYGKTWSFNLEDLDGIYED